MKLQLMAAAVALMLVPILAQADDAVPIGDDSQPVPLDLPGSGNMPRAGDAQPVGTAPGGPIEAPEVPNTDPIAPNEPPAPGQ